MTLVVIALANLAGLAAIALWGAPGWMGAAWALALVPLAWTKWGQGAAAVLVAAAAVALVGGLRFEMWRDRPEPALAAFTGQEVTVEGVVASEPDPRFTSTRYEVRARAVEAGGRRLPISGGILITTGQYAEYLPGDRVRVAGLLEVAPIFVDFDYRGYLARRGIVGTMRFPKVALVADGGWSPGREEARLRLALDHATQRALPEPAASLASGIAFGRDGSIPDKTYDDFRRAGLAHIVAVSGSNVALVAALAFIVLTPLIGRRWAIWPALLLVAFYLVAAGLSASVVRAGLMASVLLFGLWLGRTQSALAALGAATIGMTLWSPGIALDLGFQLSLSATAGLIVFAPWIAAGIEVGLTRLRMPGRVPAAIVQGTALTLAASAATLPIVAINFGQVSLIGPVANIAVEPLFAVALPAAGLTALGGTVADPIGWGAGLVAYYPLAAMLWLAHKFASVPGAAVGVPRPDGGIGFAAYAGLCVPGWFAYRYLPSEAPPPRPLPRRVRRALVAGPAAGLAVIAGFVSFAPIGGPGELRIDVLDVGQGDAILVTTPGGHRVLVDGGTSSIGLARELGAVLPHWERKIDTVVVTHPLEDHIAGVSGLLTRFRTGGELDTGATNTTEAFAAYRARAANRREVHRGDRWKWDGATFEVLWPPAGYETKELNDTSVVLRVTYGSVRVLLTGDFEAPAQEALIALEGEGMAADVLKVPHHGSKSSAPAFFAAVQPSLAVISVGAGNQFGHPSPEVLNVLSGTPIYRTDMSGRVRIDIDGERIRVRPQR